MKIFPILFAGLMACCTLQAQQTLVKTLDHDGLTRTYRLFVPAGFTSGGPLVINLHGFGSDAAQQELYSTMNLQANPNNFLVAYPQGTVANFDTFSAAHWNSSFGTGVDDVGFIDKLIDRLYTDYDVDLSRVYATGMSNGGFMSYQLACHLDDRIAAIGSVTGSMNLLQEANCNATRAIPVLQMHGTADSTVPFSGDSVLLSIPEVIEFWIANNQCDTSAVVVTPLPNTHPGDGSSVTLYHYPNCNSGTEIMFYRIDNGGHTWPGSFSVPSFGNTNQDIDGAEEIWAFFSQITHPSPRAGVLLGLDDPDAEAALDLFPNPVSDGLSLRFEVRRQGFVEIEILDGIGRRAALLASGAFSPGTHEIHWNRADSHDGLAAGPYFLLIREAESVRTRIVILE